MSTMAVQPYNYSVLVTKSDTVNQDGSLASAAGKAIPFDALYIGGAGIVHVILENGVIAAFTCVAGQVLEVKGIRVNSTTTSATVMNALYYV